MDTALPQKFPFILDRNLAKDNCTGNRGCTSCDTVVLDSSWLFLKLIPSYPEGTLLHGPQRLGGGVEGEPHAGPHEADRHQGPCGVHGLLDGLHHLIAHVGVPCHHLHTILLLLLFCYYYCYGYTQCREYSGIGEYNY